jgi:GT2 family glycosyltransferase
MATPTISVVIPTHDTRELTLRCLASLDRGGAAPVEVIVVDDASSDGTAEAVRDRENRVVVVETDGNIGFSRAVNLGAERTTGDLLLVLNSDTEIGEGAFDALARSFSDDRTLGIGGAELIDTDGAPQWRAGKWPTAGWLFAQASGLGPILSRIPGRGIINTRGAVETGAVDWVTGAAMAIRREVWESRGPFDTGYRFYCQDLDLCFEARRAGWSVAVIPGFSVVHHHGATISVASGASGSFHPAHLWSDLVRFTKKFGGAGAAARAAAVLSAGAHLRLAGRAVAGVLSSDRDAWKRDSDGYREGLKALAGEADRSS